MRLRPRDDGSETIHLLIMMIKHPPLQALCNPKGISTQYHMRHTQQKDTFFCEMLNNKVINSLYTFK